MSVSTDYGEKFFHVHSDGDCVCLMADRMEVLPSGALVAMGGFRAEGDLPKRLEALYAWAPGRWDCFYAASMISGEPVCQDSQ